MGDKVKLPRAAEDEMGIADVLNSISNRRFVAPIYASTWYQYGNQVNGGVLETRDWFLLSDDNPARISFHLAQTTSHINKFRMHVRKARSDGVSFVSLVILPGNPVMGSTGNLWGATTGWKSFDMVPYGAGGRKYQPGDSIFFLVQSHTDNISRISVFINKDTRRPSFF